MKNSIKLNEEEKKKKEDLLRHQNKTKQTHIEYTKK